MEEIYYKNQALLAKYNPLLACQLDRVDCSSLQFCRTHVGELNLVDTQAETPIYLHQPAGAAWEATQWAKIQPLDKTDVLFVYGIGLGYCYFSLLDWLKRSKKHYLVFIEDDLRVLHRFLETREATQIIKNKQVVVCGAPFLRQKDYAWKDLGRDLPEIFWAFCQSSAQVSALPAYFFARFPFFDTFATQWYGALGRSRRRLKEFLAPIIDPIFRNFYANLPYIWQGVPASILFGELASIPTTLAGAGPSLEKQLPLLGTQRDKALLLAGGSGMNAVTHAGIMPHAGAAIDPTATQASRQLTSFAFEVPVFYQNRYNAEAFLQIHGPRLYVCGSGDFPIGAWFENMLGIDNSQEIIRGVSTSNFLLEIAALLGCDPIILVGTDLAYTQGRRYAAGVIVSTIDNNNEKKPEPYDLLPVPGVSGPEVFSKLEWCLEAMCMTDFKERHPQIVFLNATEGGMSIDQVPNVSFSETARELLTKSWDVQGFLHGAIQNAAAKNGITQTQVMETIDKWKKSLKRSLDYIKKLKKSLRYNKRRFLKGEPLPYGPYSGQATLWEIELHQEVSYEYLLRILNRVFETLHRRLIQEIKLSSSEKQRLLRQFYVEEQRMRYLEKQVNYHLRMLRSGQQAFRKFQDILKRPHSAKLQKKNSASEIQYLGSNGSYVINEPELGLYLESKFQPETVPTDFLASPGQQSPVAAIMGEKAGKAHGQTLYLYPSGKVKIDSYYEDGDLHGPWSYFAESGRLLVRSWFVQGLRQGSSCYYYSGGQLYSRQTYRHGQPHGQWRYYYLDGTLKTVEHYEDGRLHGEVQLYFSNGRLKKELHFKYGQLCGKERMWGVNGDLIFEASYGAISE